MHLRPKSENLHLRLSLLRLLFFRQYPRFLHQLKVRKPTIFNQNSQLFHVFQQELQRLTCICFHLGITFTKSLKGFKIPKVVDESPKKEAALAPPVISGVSPERRSQPSQPNPSRKTSQSSSGDIPPPMKQKNLQRQGSGGSSDRGRLDPMANFRPLGERSGRKTLLPGGPSFPPPG